MTLPEAYEFFFCDTIAEEDEEAEEAAEASQVPADVQWPDVCEFFFRDCQAQKSGLRARSPTPPLKAEPVPAPVPGDPMPISIPEAYEHFLGEDRLRDVLGPASLQLQAAELPRPAPQGVESGTRPETSQATAEQLDLVVRQAGACHVGLGRGLSRSWEHTVQGFLPAGPLGRPRPGPWVMSQWGGLGDDLKRKQQFLAIPGHNPGGADQARSAGV